MTQKHFGYKSKNHFFTFLLCWTAYASTYICRLNFSAAMPELQANAVFSETRIAAVSSAFFICYGIGQFVSGLIGDRADTRKLVFSGLLISALCNIGIFCVHTYAPLLLLWAANGIAQSMVWTPILKIASLNFDASTREKFGIDMSTTVPIGTLLSYAVSLLTLLFLPWQYVFLTCGLFELFVSVIWMFGTRGRFRPKAEHPSADAQKTDIKNGLGNTFKAALSGGVLLMLIPIVIQGTLKDSVTQWVPAFFTGTFGSDTSFSLLLTMLLPIVNVTGAYFAKAIHKKLHSEIGTSMIFFGISIVFLLILKLFGTKSMALALLSMAGVTNCMFAVNVMLITMVPLQFSTLGNVSTVGGLLNAVAYIGCGALNLLAGRLLETQNGWNSLFWLWIVLAAVAVTVSAMCIPMWKRFCKKNAE